jgi:hypothetical protein
VKLFIQSAAENDILIQFEWYATKGLFHIARRFRAVRILHGRRDIEAILGTQDVEQPD